MREQKVPEDSIHIGAKRGGYQAVGEVSRRDELCRSKSSSYGSRVEKEGHHECAGDGNRVS